MTTQEKQMIASLSEKGLGYRKIAAQIGISEKHGEILSEANDRRR